jgi:tetratricopeptide (TPR) repeat protein
MLLLVQDGIAINPHYRKLTPIVADALADWGDWKNATWIWESVLKSRPYVVALLANAARGQLQAGNLAKAQESLSRAMTIQPSAPSLATLQVMLWSRSENSMQQAGARAKELLRSGAVEYDLLRTAYYLGMRNKDPELAILALELRIEKWPNQAVDSWLKLGDIYNSTEAKDERKALHAYSAALEASASANRASVLAMIPPAYRARMKY